MNNGEVRSVYNKIIIPYREILLYVQWESNSSAGIYNIEMQIPVW